MNLLVTGQCPGLVRSVLETSNIACEVRNDAGLSFVPEPWAFRDNDYDVALHLLSDLQNPKPGGN